MDNSRVTDQIKIRRDKISKLRELGYDPFDNTFKPTHTAVEVISKYGKLTSEELASLNEELRLAGRVIAKRDFGKSLFFHLMDDDEKIQCYIQRDRISKEKLKFFQKYVDIGDIVGIKGTLFRTKTGELTIGVDEFKILTKSIRPLPEKWHGLQDVEIRYRRRYLDLIANPDVREVFKRRTEIIKFIRDYLDERGFFEVETPILHTVAGGAAAKPFVTHHNALNRDLFLRIAPELYLKRLIVGGYNKVYEIGRVFRNEGISTKHNPEFTMIEFYQTYSDYKDLMVLIEDMISSLVLKLFGGFEVKFGDRTIDFSKPWKRISILDFLVGRLGEDILKDEKFLFSKADEYGVKHHGIKGKAIVELFEIIADEDLLHPTFVYGFPLDVSPLAKRSKENPEITDRFELFINGWEIANAFSELNDPEDQRQRFLEQLKQKEKGEEEYHEMDEDFIIALEHGMPPTAGAGIGVDRLVMLLTDSKSIRDVIFFPHLRS